MIATPEHAANLPPVCDLSHPADRVCPLTGAMLPVDVDEAIDMRAAILKAAQGSSEIQQHEMGLCRNSILYWLNMYGWTFVIRKYGDDGKMLKRGEYEPHIPFVTWPVQDKALMDLVDCVVQGQDALIDKSRDMGASWLLVALGVWFWLFVEDAQLGYCGRIEDDIDKAGNPKCLFWKADYLIGRLPEWMVPTGDASNFVRGTPCRSHLIIKNPDNGAVIRGEATTDHIFRGDRLTFIGYDEFAAHEHGTAGWQAASDSTACKIANSTPIGPGTEYSRQRHQGVVTGQPKVIELGYWNHPDKGQGRKPAVDEDGSIAGIAGRPYWDTPFFREEAKRRDSADLGQNVLIDHTTSGDLFFNASVVTRHMLTHGADPVRMEIVRDDRGEYRLDEDEQGRWYVWEQPKQTTNYVAFCDLSHGKGASNSVCAFMDTETGEVVAEFVDPYISTYDLADEVCLVGKKVYNGSQRMAFMGYESNGPGEDWHRDLRRNKYGSVYFRRQLGRRVEKRTKEFGWRSGRREKRALLTGLGRALLKGEAVIHSRPGLTECLEYVFFDDGSIGPGHLADETSGARESHGDRVIAYAGCVFMRAEASKYIKPDEPADKPGTLGHFLGIEETMREIEAGKYK